MRNRKNMLMAGALAVALNKLIIFPHRMIIRDEFRYLPEGTCAAKLADWMRGWMDVFQGYGGTLNVAFWVMVAVFLVGYGLDRILGGPDWLGKLAIRLTVVVVILWVMSWLVILGTHDWLGFYWQCR